jgi:hypothetical protein
MSLVAAVIAGILTAIMLFKFIFKDANQFIQTIKYWLSPFGIIRGEFDKEFKAEIEMFFWLGGSIGMAIWVYSLFQ